jgi:hypothetical protein
MILEKRTPSEVGLPYVGRVVLPSDVADLPVRGTGRGLGPGQGGEQGAEGFWTIGARF